MPQNCIKQIKTGFLRIPFFDSLDVEQRKISREKSHPIARVGTLLFWDSPQSVLDFVIKRIFIVIFMNAWQVVWSIKAMVSTVTVTVKSNIVYQCRETGDVHFPVFKNPNLSLVLPTAKLQANVLHAAARKIYAL